MIWSRRGFIRALCRDSRHNPLLVPRTVSYEPTRSVLINVTSSLASSSGKTYSQPPSIMARVSTLSWTSLVSLFNAPAAYQLGYAWLFGMSEWASFCVSIVLPLRWKQSLVGHIHRRYVAPHGTAKQGYIRSLH